MVLWVKIGQKWRKHLLAHGEYMSNNIFNTDFQDFLKALNSAEVRYVLVGGYSVVFHGYQRVTGDLDLFLDPTENNYKKLSIAFAEFGLPTNAIKLEDFINPLEVDVFTFGRPPTAIDLMIKLANFSFEEVYEYATKEEIDNIIIKVIHINHLKIAKKLAGRFKDLDDLEHLNTP
jgi:predicted nucleotidyltransferase